MKRRELESALLTLETTPVILHQVAFRSGSGNGAVSPDFLPRLESRIRLMATIEEEVWTVRIRRLLAEDAAVLPDLDRRGREEAAAAAIASSDWRSPLERFVLARGRNNSRFRTVSQSEWDRTGLVPRVGKIALRDIPRLMAEEDLRHLGALVVSEPDALRESFAGALAPAFARNSPR